MINKIFKVIGVYFTCVILHETVIPPLAKSIKKYTRKWRAELLEEAKEKEQKLTPEDEDFLEEYHRDARGYCKMGF